MKKKLLYTALGLMGIMGTLSIGVTHGEYTITNTQSQCTSMNGGQLPTYSQMISDLTLNECWQSDCLCDVEYEISGLTHGTRYNINGKNCYYDENLDDDSACGSSEFRCDNGNNGSYKYICKYGGISYTVTYKSTTNGGSTEDQTATVNAGGSVDLTKIAEKNGYTFVGWNTNSTATTKLTGYSMPANNVTLYAIFKKTVTVTFSKGNGVYNITPPSSTSCTAWNTATTCSVSPATASCNAGYCSPVWSASTTNINNNITTTATCTACDAGKYTEAGNTSTSCTQCEAGYYCLAGSAKSQCTGRTKYSTAGASECSTVTVGYYTTGCDGDNKCTGESQCTAGTYCADGVQHDCVASTDTQSGTYSSTAGATSCTSADDGYYVATDNATTQTECPAGSYCPAGKIISCTTLGTDYTSDTGASAQNGCYEVLTATFNANGASVSSGSVTCKLNYGSSSCDITSPTITPAAGFEALGFNTDNTAETSILAVNTLTGISANIEYYAITKSTSSIKVTFDVNGNGGSTSTGECYKYNGSGSCSIAAPAITPADGFTKIGWNSAIDTHTSEWNEGESKIVSADATYYAQSSKAGYQVTASYIIGTGVSAYSNTPNTCDVEKVYNGASYTACNITLPTLTLRPGYNTGVWSTGTQIENPGDVISLLADETYTASATPNDNTQYIVEHYFENVDGTGFDIDDNLTDNLTGTTDTHTGAEYKVVAGFTGSAATSGAESSGDIAGNGSLTLKLYYIRNNHKITYVWSGETPTGAEGFSGDIEGVKYGSSVIIKEPATASGYLFEWTGDSSLGITSNSFTMPDDDVVLTGIWTAGEVGYTVEHYFENIDGTGFDIDDSLTDSLTGTTDTHTGAEYKIVAGFTGSSATSGAESSGDIAGDGSLTLKLYYTRDNYTLTFDPNGGSAVNPITAKYQSGVILPESKRTGYTFTGWKDENNDKFYSGDVYILSGNTTLTGQWIAETYVVTFDVNSGNALTSNTGTVTYDAAYGTLPTPSRDGYSFNGWFTLATSGTKITASTVVSATGNHTLYAQWTQDQPSGGSTGGGSSGGGGSSKAKTSSDSVKSTETQTGSKVDSSTKATDNEDNTQDSSAKASEGQNQGKTYSDEFQQAYEFAYKHGITTMDSIEKADMEGPLTRIAMAKMLSYYAINVLGQKPDTSRKIKFRDVSAALDKKYDNGVTLAYQLGIMGINMPKNRFRPNDLVTRGEFATALSRMLYGIADGKDKYYSTHMAKLMEEKIITNDNPNLQELRGYVMIMLMRSAENKSTEN